VKLKLVALSDAHLGEPISLLNYENGRSHFVAELRNLLGSTNGPVPVEQLVLVGDIVDRTLAATKEISDYSDDFFATLAEVVMPEKIVYIPGNHDHTLWTDYRKERFGPESHYISGPYGESIVYGGDVPKSDSAITNLLKLLFAYPNGVSWKEFSSRRCAFVMANPLYAWELGHQTYVFTHGTHFRRDVIQPQRVRKVLESANLLGKLGSLFPSRTDPTMPAFDEMPPLEKFVTPLVDFLWASAGDEPTSWRDSFWYVATRFSFRTEVQRKSPESSERWPQSKLSKAKQIRQLVRDKKFESKSLERWNEFFLVPMMDLLSDYHLATSNLTFVYGDTHEGGYGEYEAKLNGTTSKMRIYNTGSWVTDVKDSHPACHVFVVDEQGNESLADISYKDVKQDGEDLIQLAYRDQEHLSKKLEDDRKLLDSVIQEHWESSTG